MVAFSSFDNVMKVNLLQIALDSTGQPSIFERNLLLLIRFVLVFTTNCGRRPNSIVKQGEDRFGGDDILDVGLCNFLSDNSTRNIFAKEFIGSNLSAILFVNGNDATDLYLFLLRLSRSR